MTQLGVELVRAIVESALGPHDYITASKLDELRAAWDARQHKHAVIFSDCPDQEVAKSFLQSRAPIIVFAEAPGEIVAAIMAERNINLRDAIRGTCQHLSALHDFYLNGRAMRIARRSRGTSVSSLSQTIVDHFQIKLDPLALDKILGKLVPPGSPGGGIVEDLVEIRTRFPRPNGFPVTGQASSEAELIQTVQDAFSPMMRGHTFDGMRWPKEMFANMEKGGIPPSGAVELLGRARMLIYGPYLFLPCGRWIASIQMESARNLSGNSLVIDICCNAASVLSVGRVELPPRGTFDVDVEFEVTEPKLPLEIRIALEHGAIEGSLDLIGVEIKRTEIRP